MLAPSQIVIFTRSWEVYFHLSLVREFQADFKDSKIIFVTFFSWARDIVTQAGYDCVYLPDALQAVDTATVSADLLKDVDREIKQINGAGLRYLLQSERFLPSNERDIYEMMVRHVAVISKLVTERTLSISSFCDHFVYWLAASLAMSRNGDHFAFVASGAPGNRVLAFKTPLMLWKGPKTDDPEQLLHEATEKLSIPVKKRLDYMEPITLNTPFLRRLKLRLGEIRANENDLKHKSYFAVPSYTLSRVMLSKFVPFKWTRAAKLPVFDVNHVSEVRAARSIFVALHEEPEATILCWSARLRDQVEFVRLLSQDSPVDTLIYVKDHPRMEGRRPPDFYHRLQGVPGVRLVNHAVSSIDLIKNTHLTASLNGTVTIESWLLNKPSLTAGNSPHKHFATYCLYDSGIAKLADFLYAQLSDAPPRLSEKDTAIWEDWIRSSFKANSVPVYQADGCLQVDFSTENAARHFNFIKACLTQGVMAQRAMT